MNLTRLMALGLLARHGPMHGHQIRRWAEVTGVGEWGGVSIGALYRDLRLMEAEGLVEAVRTEQVGRRPARTVYAITADGSLELSTLWVQAMRTTEAPPNPLGVALTFAFESADQGEVRDVLRYRRERLAVTVREVESEHARGLAAGYLTQAQAAAMRRSVLLLRAELAWHDEFDQTLDKNFELRRIAVAIIEARGLARTFTSRNSRTRTVEAVRGVDLTVAEGEIVGFLGPNGAGKTTTLRMLTTLLRPTAGTATVAGADLRTDPLSVRSRIGYVPQGIGATMGGTDPACKVIEELRDQGAMYHLPAVQTAVRAAALIDQFELTGLEDRLVKTLSGGQRRRLEIALGLVHRPSLVFLDEPTTGLDPQSRSNLWDHVGKLRSQLGTTVFLTTHYLEEADALCDRVFIIDCGKIVASGTPAQLKDEICGDFDRPTLDDVFLTLTGRSLRE